MREEFDSTHLRQMVEDLRDPVVCLLHSLPASVKPTGRDLYGECGASSHAAQDNIEAFPDWTDFGDSGWGDLT